MFGFWKNRLTDVLIDAVKADGGTLVHLATVSRMRQTSALTPIETTK